VLVQVAVGVEVGVLVPVAVGVSVKVVSILARECSRGRGCRRCRDRPPAEIVEPQGGAAPCQQPDGTALVVVRPKGSVTAHHHRSILVDKSPW